MLAIAHTGESLDARKQTAQAWPCFQTGDD